MSWYPLGDRDRSFCRPMIVEFAKAGIKAEDMPILVGAARRLMEQRDLPPTNREAEDAAQLVASIKVMGDIEGMSMAMIPSIVRRVIDWQEATR